jgi:hypothetical protein
MWKCHLNIILSTGSCSGVENVYIESRNFECGMVIPLKNSKHIFIQKSFAEISIPKTNELEKASPMNYT